MRKQILAGATMLALTVGVSTSAMAFDHKTGRGGVHAGRIHADAMHGYRARHGSRFAGVGARQGGWEDGDTTSGYKNLGPLGITFGCGRSYCGQGYSVSAWSY